MGKIFVRILLKLRYRLHFKGFADISSDPALLVIEKCSALDPVFVSLRWKQRLTVLLTSSLLQRIPRFLRGLFSAFTLPPYDNRVGAFSSKRLKKRLQEFSCFGDVAMVLESRKSPLLSELKPNRKVYFVQVQGMQGSYFSPHPSKEAKKVNLWALLKNGIFFMPRRTVTITLSEAPEIISEEFVHHWFTAHEKPYPQPTAYYFWKKADTSQSRITAIVIQELARLSKKDHITESMDLYEDLNLDSLDVTEILVFLEKTFQESAHFDSLRSVKDVIRAAEGLHPAMPSLGQIQEKRKKGWTGARADIAFAEGETIPEAFLRSVDRMGKAAAVVDPRDTLSYVRLKTVVMGLVALCEKLPGKNVGVLLPSMSETVGVVLALMMAKKVPTMLNWTLGNHHLEEVAKQAGLEVIVSMVPMLQSLGYEPSDELVGKIVLLEELKGEITTEMREQGIKRTRQTTEELLHELGRLDPDETAVLLFTSGTEKAPKGVPLTHRNILSNQRSAIQNLGFTKSDVLLGILPPFHVFGFSLTHLLPLMIGCRVVLHPLLLDLATISQLIQQYGVTIVCTAPTFLKALVGLNKPSELESVRCYIVGAEKTPPGLKEQLKCPLFEGYGLTECSPLVAFNYTGDPALGVGYPVGGVKIRILDGVVAVQGPSVFGGYLDGSLPFVEIDGEKWFVTGDLGKIENGALHLIGRLSRTTKIGGELISFPALEQSLQMAFPEAQVAIVAQEAQLILYANKPLELEKVNQELKKYGWSNLVRIKEIRFLEQLPLTSTGKIDYKKLRP